LVAIEKMIGKKILMLTLEGAEPAPAPAAVSAETTPPPKLQTAVAQKERHHNRHKKIDHGRQKNHPDIESEENDGSFGRDLPSFLQKR
jgi:hypothetical protein